MAIHLGLASLAFVPLSDCPWLHPGRQAAILTSDGKAIGTLGVIHPEAAANYAVSPRTALLDLEIGPLLAAASHERQYRPLPKFPAVIRDLAIVVDVEITAAALSTAIVEAGGEILKPFVCLMSIKVRKFRPAKNHWPTIWFFGRSPER